MNKNYETIIIREIASETELAQMYYVRWLVLREPLGMDRGTEQDKHEKNSFNLAAFFDGQIVGAARVRKASEELGIISYVAVLARFRNKGIGTILVKRLIEKAKQERIKVVRLRSRITALEFYRRLGFQEKNEPFEYLGIPHIIMDMRL
jgi:N-acetylglutamate synthase-like GNAT family acetyltransferase